jgi:hypothetical protein
MRPGIGREILLLITGKPPSGRGRRPLFIIGIP